MICAELNDLTNIVFSNDGALFDLKCVLNEKEFNDEQKHISDLLEKVRNNPVVLQSRQAQATQTEIERAPELRDIISKLTKANLLICGNFPTDEKNYHYKIKTSVKKFVEELKRLEITDNDSKRTIYENIYLPKEQNNAYLKQAKWEYFRREFSRKFIAH